MDSYIGKSSVDMEPARREFDALRKTKGIGYVLYKSAIEWSVDKKRVMSFTASIYEHIGIF